MTRLNMDRQCGERTDKCRFYRSVLAGCETPGPSMLPCAVYVHINVQHKVLSTCKLPRGALKVSMRHHDHRADSRLAHNAVHNASQITGRWSSTVQRPKSMASTFHTVRQNTHRATASPKLRTWCIFMTSILYQSL